MSDTNRGQLAYAKEVTPGVNPGGTFKIVRFTGETLRQDTSIQTSSEIRPDRQIVDVIRVGARAMGDTSHELSYSAHDDWIASALQASAWSSVVKVGPATTISASASDNSLNDSANGFSTLQVNQWIKVSGFTKAANNGIFKIVSKPSAGKITISGTTLEDESAGASVIIVMGEQIVNGVTFDTYTLERKYTDLPATEGFVEFNMMAIESWSVNVQRDQIITMAFEWVGKREISRSATIASSYDAAPTWAITAGVDNVLGILEAQVRMDTYGFTFKTNNGLRTREIIGSLGPVSIGSGTFTVEGTLQVYFSTHALYDKYLNFGTTSLALVVQDASGNTYVFDFPRVRLTAGQRPVTGQNQDVMADMNFQAFMHPSEGVTVRIVRFQ